MRAMRTWQAWIAEAERLAGQARDRFGGLDERKLNWKPAAREWSIAQCLDHLARANRTYFPLFEQVLAGSKQATALERLPVWPWLCGRLILAAMTPSGARLLQAPAAFRPAEGGLGARAVEDFARHQAELARWFERLAHLDPRRVIITSPANRLATYSLAHTAAIILAHERLHIHQAERVLERMARQGGPAASPG